MVLSILIDFLRHLGWIASHQRVRRDILRHNGPGAHHGSGTNLHARIDGDLAANPAVVLNHHGHS